MNRRPLPAGVSRAAMPGVSPGGLSGSWPVSLAHLPHDRSAAVLMALSKRGLPVGAPCMAV